MSAEGIEHFLLLRPAWVPASEIAAWFRVDERELRSTGGEPGLCSAFAISSNLGYKHVRHATEEEFQAFQSRLRSHGWAEIQRADQLVSARNGVPVQPKQVQPATAFDQEGQGLLLS